VDVPVAAAEPVVAAEVPVAETEPVVEQPVAATPVKTVSHEEIAKLAFCYYADRGFQGGDPQEDWARAEQTLLLLAGAL
jgi:hypothetical protein